MGEGEGEDGTIYVAHPVEGSSYGVMQTNSKVVYLVNHNKGKNPVGKPVSEIDEEQVRRWSSGGRSVATIVY